MVLQEAAANPGPPKPKNELILFFYSIPLITRTILTLTLTLSILCHIQLIPYGWVMFNLESIIYRLQIWKLATGFFLTGISFNLIFDLVFVYRYSTSLEQVTFAGRKADYLYFLILSGLISLAGAWYYGLAVLFQSLLLTIVTLWSRENQEMTVSFYFGIQFKAKYLPFVIVGIEALLSVQIPISSTLGLASAFIYHYLARELNFQKSYLKAPKLLEKLLPPTQEFSGGSGFSVKAPTIGKQPDGSYSWGKGFKLGE